MAYTTVENLISLIPYQELVNLTNDDDSKEINEKNVNCAISYAEEFINSYLRNKYSLPLKYVPALIVQLSTDIAAYRIYSRRPRKLPEHIKESYDAAVRILKDIQKEQMILDLPDEHPDKEITKPASMIVTNKTKSSKIFSDSLMERFRG